MLIFVIITFLTVDFEVARFSLKAAGLLPLVKKQSFFKNNELTVPF